MSKAIRLHQQGGPEVMAWEDVEVGEPGPGQARVRHNACGLNYIDVYHRSGLYPLQLPSGIGMEAAGVVEAVGPSVTNVKKGDRVAYASGPVGAYAEVRIMAVDRLVNLPDWISFDQGAAMMLQGMTTQYLLKRTYKVQPGDTILIHAAAGGVGLIVCQWAKALGATVIGTVGSDDKAPLAKKAGCKHVIVTSTEKFVDRVKAITKGKGVPVVYDGVGKTTWEGTLDCLSPRGLIVSFGNASGPVAPVNLGILSTKGSLYVTRPTLGTHIASRADLVGRSNALFDIVKSGKVKIETTAKYKLADAAQAHRDLESRKTTGSIILVP